MSRDWFQLIFQPHIEAVEWQRDPVHIVCSSLHLRLRQSDFLSDITIWLPWVYSKIVFAHFFWTLRPIYCLLKGAFFHRKWMFYSLQIIKQWVSDQLHGLCIGWKFVQKSPLPPWKRDGSDTFQFSTPQSFQNIVRLKIGDTHERRRVL